MFAARLYDFIVASDLPLPELPEAAGESAIDIRAGALSAVIGPWFDIWPGSDGSGGVRAARTAAGYQVRHADLATFDVDRRRRTIRYDAPGCDVPQLRHFLIDQVVPLMLSLDALVLHASSAEIGGAVHAFIGRGGAGKSTLALALARHGQPMVSDDGLLLRRQDDCVVATPAYPAVRLWGDSAATLAVTVQSITSDSAHKGCFREPAAFAPAAGSLARIYVIDPRPAASIAFERVAGPEAVIELVRQTYRLALDDRDALAWQLDAIVELSRVVPVWRLSHPRALPRAMALANAVAAHAHAAQAVNP